MCSFIFELDPVRGSLLPKMHCLGSILSPFLAGSAVESKRCSGITVSEKLCSKTQIPVLFIIKQITAVCPPEGMRRFCFCFRICRVWCSDILSSNRTDSSSLLFSFLIPSIVSWSLYPIIRGQAIPAAPWQKSWAITASDFERDALVSAALNGFLQL